MWKNFVNFLKDEDGTISIEYLILAFLLTGVAGLIAAGITDALRTTHNSQVNSITDILGSGY
ncbi:MAG: Flp family type IVb pilin [Thermosipho sp. (in: Bacteria)]|nr:Flp family type IVb pilin [Thermosipho sp. (in: thermotogales)]